MLPGWCIVVLRCWVLWFNLGLWYIIGHLGCRWRNNCTYIVVFLAVVFLDANNYLDKFPAKVGWAFWCFDPSCHTQASKLLVAYFLGYLVEVL